MQLLIELLHVANLLYSTRELLKMHRHHWVNERTNSAIVSVMP